MDRRGFVISPIVLVVVYAIIIMLMIHNYTVNDIVRKGILLQTGMMVYDISEEKERMDLENLVVVTALGEASESNDLRLIERNIRQEVLDRYNMAVNVDITEQMGNLTIEVRNGELQEVYVLDYPFSELHSIEPDISFVTVCISGCSCSDMSYLNRMIECVDELDSSSYDFSFSEHSGCYNGEFEAKIYVSKANNTLSELFPHLLNSGSAIEFSC